MASSQRPEAEKQRWRQASHLTAVVSVLLCLGMLVGIVFLSQQQQQHNAPDPSPSPSPAPTCAHAARPVSRSELIDAPLTPFSELTAQEVEAVRSYFEQAHGARNVTKARMRDNFIHFMEAIVPPKRLVLDYLERGGIMPERRARVVLFRGNATPPVVEEYEVPVLAPAKARIIPPDSRQTRVPFSLRPFSRVEFREMFQRLTPLVARELGPLIQESYGARMRPRCKTRCVTLSMTPVSSAFLPPDTRAAWFWLAYDIEFFTLYPLDLQFLVDTTHVDSAHLTVQRVYYADQYFDSFSDLMARYRRGSINMTRVKFPDKPEKELYSSLHLRGEPFPADGKPPPMSVMPQDIRFKVRGSRVEYMRWAFTVRVSPAGGMQLFDVNFGGERIAYEVSLQEVAVLYAGYSPVSSVLFYADSAGLFGTRMRGMLEGVDCPWHAAYLDTQLFASNDDGLKRFPRAMCLFEHNSELPLRRHRAYSMTGAFYGGLSDTVLVLRAYVSLINYDYVLDYVLHANGAIEVTISSTGYLATGFYTSPEERFGTRVHRHVTAGMHQHLFHIKVDLDVNGTRNSFSSWDVGVEEKADTWGHDPEASHTQAALSKRLYRREGEACYRYNFSAPKDLLVSGGPVSELGHRRSYRVLPRGMSPALLPPGDGFESSVAWARCQVAVTRQRDSEATSSSVYAMWDARSPVVNFTSYLADDESIEEEDLVTWVTLGTYHLPHLENTPNTATVGTKLSLFLTPFNFFPQDPSMASRDAVRVSPRDPKKPYDGAIVERYNTSSQLTCLPDVTLPDEELKHSSKDLFH